MVKKKPKKVETGRAFVKAYKLEHLNHWYDILDYALDEIGRVQKQGNIVGEMRYITCNSTLFLTYWKRKKRSKRKKR